LELIGIRLLAGGLAGFDFERFGVFLPPAGCEAALEGGDGSERGGLLALFVFGVGFPVESGVGLRTVHGHKLGEILGGLVVTILVEGFAAFVVEFLETLEAFLLALALFLLPFPRFFFAFAPFLLALLIAFRGALLRRQRLVWMRRKLCRRSER